MSRVGLTGDLVYDQLSDWSLIGGYSYMKGTALCAHGEAEGTMKCGVR